jgi:predicted O-linked N-acetylglucosamine transferase (SPINDLY family)
LSVAEASEEDMAENGFPSAIAKVTAGALDLAELITAAGDLAQDRHADLAIQLYKVWIAFNPHHPQRYAAHFNAASLLTEAGDLAGSRAELEAALEQKADFAPALINLGAALERQGDVEGALARWREVPSHPALIDHMSVGYHLAALKQLGRVLGEGGRHAAAEAALRHSLDIQPHQRDVIEQFVALRLNQCKWPAVEPWEAIDRAALLSQTHPLSVAALTDDPWLQLASGAGFVENANRDRLHDPEVDRRNAPIDLTGRRLKVGYVSSDLREHAVGYLMAELFELHDRQAVETFAYYCGPEAGLGLNTRIRDAVEHWTDIRGLSDQAAARAIAADGIDILVDVNGHTRDARLGVFALRPAPIQVNWLGYPGTTGSPFHHYIVADAAIIPPGSEAYYSEKVVRLACYQPNDRKRAVAEARPTRTDAGLPEDGIVFCCFNGPQKITPFTFARWMEILKRTDGSVLWLLESTAETQGNLMAHADAAGVARGRLIFAPKQGNPWHLARYPLADLFLDTAPYGAHTTASDALFMGVPVLTFWGRNFAARVCGSLVSAAGLPDLVCETPRDYVERAIALARDPAQIAALKARLEAGRATCDLFAMERLVADLEGLYGDMVRDYQAGALPRPDLANLEAYLEVGVGLDRDEREMIAEPDYAGLWKAGLMARHLARPLGPDNRAWTAETMMALAPPSSPPPSPAHNDAGPPRRSRRAATAG